MTAAVGENGSWRRWWVLASTVGALALVASFNGIWNGFAYDDVFVVQTNELVHSVQRAWRLFVLPYWPLQIGGDGYRPLTMIAFAMQWVLGSGSPTVFHAVSIALYVATSIAAFWLASQLLPRRFAWLVAAAFAVHPVHVESVANVVGQSEVWAGLLLLCSTAAYIQWRRSGAWNTRRRLLIAAGYLAACLFKEHAVVLPAVLLVAEVVLISGAEPLRARLRAEFRFFASLFVIACAFVVLREMIIGKRLGGFDPFIPFVSLRVDYVDRVLTMLGVVPHWVRLFLWPASLSSEYGPPQYPIAHGVAGWQLPGLLILAGTLGLGVATARRAPAVSFGIAWLVITLLPSSNFVLPAGILMAERTLFSPSFGAMVIVVAALSYCQPYLRSSPSRIAALVGIGGLLWGGIAKSLVQSAVWRDNDSLFAATVRESPLVYRTHYIMGNWLMGKGKRQLGEGAYLTALGLFPHDPFVWYNMGQEYFAQQRYEQAYRLYEQAERVLPNFQDSQVRMALSKIMLGRYEEAESLAVLAIRNKVGDQETLRAIMGAKALTQLDRGRLGERLARKPPVMRGR